MSQQHQLNIKGILQNIIDRQRGLQNNIVHTHNLINNDTNKPDLTLAFDTHRLSLLSINYSAISKLLGAMKLASFKWWKNMQPFTQEDVLKYNEYISSETQELELTNVELINIAIMDELREIADAVRQGEPRDKIVEEYIDAFHFMIQLGLQLGITTEQEINDAYIKKNEINHVRQSNNY